MSANFIETSTGIWVSVSSIETIRPENDSALARAIIQTKSNQYTSENDFSTVCAQVAPILPIIQAATNWVLLQYITDSGDVLKFPIIGWRYNNTQLWPIHLDRHLYEIIDPTENIANAEEYAMSPTGQIFDPSNRCWNNYADWLEAMNRAHGHAIPTPTFG